MIQRRAVPKQHLLVSALVLALGQPAFAQDATAPAAPEEDASRQTTTPEDATELDAVVVTGIRASLNSSMNLKRDAQGIVDGIVAEDIGKFPDTNLAESMQRISGVSIDRTSTGEGQKVTVRGVGPDYNLVLLNGRQMPTAFLGPGGSGVSNSRAFDFANLASEAVSAVEVFKTSRASTPAGGIGATINIKTARPLSNKGPVANLGIKGVWDTSNDNLPDSLQGDSVTPEISGIFSTTFGDDRFGIGGSFSYQERDSGYSQVGVYNGWRGPFRGDENNWGTIPQPGSPGSERITNRPDPTDIYSVPQNLNYNVNGIHRERTNGQVVFQWAPTDRVTTTLDYTYSQNKVEQQRNELSVWFNFGPSTSAWTDGPVAAPLFYSEIIDANSAPADLSMGGSRNATVSENKSLGFNVEWEVTDALDLEFDYHDSNAESRPDSRYGSAGVLGVAAFVRGTTSVDFSGEFPIVNVQLPTGLSAVSPAQAMVTGSVFHNAYTRSEIEQGRIGGRWEFGEASALDFGVSSTEVNNRTAYGFMQRDTWGGIAFPGPDGIAGTSDDIAARPGDFDDSIWSVDNMAGYFNQFSGHNSPFFTNTFLLFDFERLRNRAAEITGRPDWYQAPTTYSRDLRTSEKSRSAYLQWSTRFETAMPINLAAGVRYEETEVVSSALVPIATGISWGAANELNVIFGEPGFTTLKGEYDYWLPSIDASLEITDEMVLRASYGETIGRPGWADIQGGQTLDQIVRVNGGTGNQGNPALEPLNSENFDLSFEWYYAPSSYLSAGYFRKDIANYPGTTQLQDTPFDLRTPVGGAYWNAALAAGGCPSSDVVCIRNYILNNFNGQPGVTRTGTDGTGNATGTIVGQPNDPVANFRITTVANQNDATLDGWEFNVQHVFGESGFGLSANYTIVDSDLTYDNAVVGEQFALEGLSDAANLVAFYDKGPWQVRAAYNWRDEFLSGRFDGAGPNPNYVEAYGQFDLSVGYKVNDRLTLQFEGINLTDETQRIHGRNSRQVLFATQTGPRYAVGLRYNFF